MTFVNDIYELLFQGSHQVPKKIEDLYRKYKTNGRPAIPLKIVDNCDQQRLEI